MSLYRTEAAALERYPRTTFPVGRSWNETPLNKRRKKGSDRREGKRLMRKLLPTASRARTS